MEKLKVIKDKLKQISWFEKFYGIEKVVQSLKRGDVKL